MHRILPRDFYDRGAEAVARDLLGKWLIREAEGIEQIGRVVETEAYLGPQDLAAHSSKGRTARTAIMFGPPGFAYVYLIYGMYHCMNVVVDAEGVGAAVLIRALEPVANIEGTTNGPGRLSRSLGIDLSLNGHDLTTGELVFAEPEGDSEPFSTVARPRVGVDYAGEWAKKPLRFYIEGSRFVSRR